MKPKIFLSHASHDKDRVRQLATDLRGAGIEVWFDEWDIRVGEPVTARVQAGLRESDYIAIWLTAAAVNSNWVQREWQARYSDEIKSGTPVILPLLAEECEIPVLLADKKYADFRDYKVGFRELVETIWHSDPAGIAAREPIRKYSYHKIPDRRFNPEEFRHARMSSIMLDARYRLDELRQSSASAPVIANVSIDETACSWYPTPDIADHYSFEKTDLRSVSLESLDSLDPSLEPLYRAAQWGFSQGDGHPSRVKDPILDFVIVNPSEAPVVISDLGVCPVALWRIPKMVPQPQVLKVFSAYELHCDFTASLCYVTLADPVILPPAAAIRLQARLMEFVSELSRKWHSNESLVSIVVNGAQRHRVVSNPIYLGIVG